MRNTEDRNPSPYSSTTVQGVMECPWSCLPPCPAELSAKHLVCAIPGVTLSQELLQLSTWYSHTWVSSFGNSIVQVTSTLHTTLFGVVMKLPAHSSQVPMKCHLGSPSCEIFCEITGEHTMRYVKQLGAGTGGCAG